MTARAHVLVVGNEKGGSGKSTTAMHLAIGLMRAGRRVGVIDADIRQGSLRRFIENRRAYAATITAHVPVPETFDPGEPAAAEGRLPELVERAAESVDVLVIDTPGSATPLSELAHSLADTLVTPLNDSFVDMDVMARMSPASMTVQGPSRYADMVWKQKLARAQREGRSLDWVVLRNRLSSLDSRNKREMERALGELAKRIGFRLLPGFGERVIFRELFLAGLTIMDIKETARDGDLTMSHLAARQEVRSLIEALRLPPVASADAPA